jgi:DNA-binding cell septation regulator SpoVG
MEVKVTKLVKRQANNALKAFADVEISEGSLQLTIYGVKVFNTTEKGDFIGLPASPPKEPAVPGGKPGKWFDILGLNKEAYFKVQDAVLESWRTGNVSPSSKPGRQNTEAKAPASDEGFGGSIGSDDDGEVAPF